MTRYNNNEAITHLAMPERTIPVLLVCDKSERDDPAALSDLSPESVSVWRISEAALRSFVQTEGPETI